MALSLFCMSDPLNPLKLNVEGVEQLVASNLNKNIPDGTLLEEGVSDDLIGELSLSLDDNELIKLAAQWEGNYRQYEDKIRRKQNQNVSYVHGKQTSQTDNVEKPVPSNILFEALETFLPAALSKNPEPVVFSDNTPQGKALSSDIKVMLQYHADNLVLRQKLKKMVRHWSCYYIGVLKHGWDTSVNDISTEVVFPQDIILDPESSIDEKGNSTSYYVGERKTCTAGDLIKLYPKFKAEIKLMVSNELGTKVKYTEWWTDEYMFVSFRGLILQKAKNPHWNYDIETPAELDEYGNELIPKGVVPGNNHFAKPCKPYTFMTVFSMGKQPHDDTTLVEQNLSNQDGIIERNSQIVSNLRHANNSIAFSGDFFNKEQAKNGARAVEKGSPIWVPSGNVDAAVKRLPAPSLPQAVFVQLENMKSDLRSVFGTTGLSTQGTEEDKTVRGKILNAQHDASRIGGGIGDVIEQIADNVFNWWTQLYYVYYDEPHVGAILGQGKALQYVILRQTNIDRKLIVSVAPDSMKPKDEITEMNQAMDLWNAGALDPKTLFSLLDFPDPNETAKQVVLWKTNPQLYAQQMFPENPMMPMQPPQQGAPTEQNIPGGAEPDISAPPASAALSNVPINMQGVPQ